MNVLLIKFGLERRQLRSNPTDDTLKLSRFSVESIKQTSIFENFCSMNRIFIRQIDKIIINLASLRYWFIHPLEINEPIDHAVAKIAAFKA